MARQVIVTLVYEIDDPTVTVASEKADWLSGGIEVKDLEGNPDFRIEIEIVEG